MEVRVGSDTVELNLVGSFMMGSLVSISCAQPPILAHRTPGISRPQIEQRAKAEKAEARERMPELKKRKKVRGWHLKARRDGGRRRVGKQMAEARGSRAEGCSGLDRASKSCKVAS